MAVYEKPNGDRFTLSVSDPKDWAEHIREWFVRLGCSRLYAESVAQQYRLARKVG